LYIKEPPGRGTKRARCDREGFYLERKEKRQPFEECLLHQFPNNVFLGIGGPTEKTSSFAIPT
jgi:hypothetical protein